MRPKPYLRAASSSSRFKIVSPIQVKYAIKVDGKPDTFGVQTMAADGRSFTDVSWTAGKESEKQTAVYVRQ